MGWHGDWNEGKIENKDDYPNFHPLAKILCYFIGSIGLFFLFALPINLVGLYIIAAFNLWSGDASRMLILITFWGGLMASCISLAVRYPRDWIFVLLVAVLWNLLMFGPSFL